MRKRKPGKTQLTELEKLGAIITGSRASEYWISRVNGDGTKSAYYVRLGTKWYHLWPAPSEE
jgi:hypothetical protein